VSDIHGWSLPQRSVPDHDHLSSEARKAKANGSTRFCMGAAWRDMNGRSTHFKRIIEMVREIRSGPSLFIRLLDMQSLIGPHLVKERWAWKYARRLGCSTPTRRVS
jgi:biotin synthase